MARSMNGFAGRTLLRVVVATMVAAMLPLASGMHQARADVPVSIHVSITGDWIEFFDFTPGEAIDVSIDGEPTASIEAESNRFVAELGVDLAEGQLIVAEQGANVVGT